MRTTLFYAYLTGLAKGPMLGQCVNLIIQCGYVCITRMVDAKHYFLPQSRPRIWFIAVRSDLHASCGMSSDQFGEMIDKYLNIFSANNPMIDINKVLLGETDPIVLNFLANIKPRVPSAGHSTIWLDDHINAGGLAHWLEDRASLRYEHPDFVRAFPGVQALQARQHGNG